MLKIISIILGLLFLMFGFNNCSDVQFMPNETFNYSEIKAETLPSPNLKVFLIVDNSNTMKANQLNLSESVRSIFSKNDLSKYNTEIIVLNTSQIVDSGSVVNLKSLQSTKISASNIDYYRNLNNFGTVPGDLAGVQVVEGDNEIQLLPAPVVSKLQTGVNSYELSMTAKANQTVSGYDLFTDLDSKIKVLDPSSYLDTNKYKIQNLINDVANNESGMCAIARVLKNSDRFLQASDYSAFIVITDEDEFNASGTKCLDRIEYPSSTEDYVHLKCKSNKSEIELLKPPVEVPSRCFVSYQSKVTLAYKYKLIRTRPHYKVENIICDEQDGVQYNCRVAQELKYMNFLEGIHDCSTVTFPSEAIPGTEGCMQIYTSQTRYAYVRPGDSTNLFEFDHKYKRGESCSAQAASYLKDQVLSSFTNGEVLKEGDESCKVETVSDEYRNLASGNTSNECLSLTNDFCSQNPDLSSCSMNYTESFISEQSYPKRDYIAESNVTCDKPCSDTKVCSGFNGTVKEYFIQKNNYPAGSSCNSVARVSEQFMPNVPMSKLSSVCQKDYESVSDMSEPFKINTPVEKPISGYDGNGDVIPLKTYIKDQLKVVFGENIPAFSFIVNTDDNPIVGQKGEHYIDLASDLDANVVSVTEKDYSSSMKQFGEKIIDTLKRNILVPDYVPGSYVKSVKIKRKGELEWSEDLPISYWSSHNGRVTFSKDFTFEVGDSFQFQLAKPYEKEN